MKALRLIVVAAACLTLSSCGSSKPKDLIVGKWECTEGKEKGMVVEFAKDGTASMGMGPITLKAKYKMIDDNTVEMQMENPFADMKVEGVKVESKGPDTQKLKISVTKDTLTTTDEKGETTKFKRVQ